MRPAFPQHVLTSPLDRRESPAAAGRFPRLARLRAAAALALGDLVAVAGAAAALLPLLARPPAQRAPAEVPGAAPGEQAGGAAVPEGSDACASES